MDKETKVDYNKPVAYDSNGQPLYAHPPNGNNNNTVHISRSAEPTKPIISDSIKLKHERSKQLYPNLNLSEGEYVIRAIQRHPIGLVLPLSLGFFLMAALAVILVNFDYLFGTVKIGNSTLGLSALFMPIVALMAFVALVTYVAYYVYVNNRFYLTNESVIQEVQLGIFSKHEQTVGLANIEDASYYKNGIFQHLFDYGSIRLSTEGDETTYRFSFVANPKEHIAVLNNSVEAFKSGHPVEDGDD